MNIYQEHKEIVLAFVGALVVIFLGLGLPLILSPRLDLLEKLGLMQVTFSAVAFFVVFIALVLAITQFRKSMAKPQLNVAFNEDGDKQTSIDITQDNSSQHKLGLWVKNTGSAVTKLFQIDFELDVIFNPNLRVKSQGEIPQDSVRLSSRGDTRVISFCSFEKVYCFVGRPVQIPWLVLEVHPGKYEEYKTEYKLRYRVFGD